MIYTLKVNGVEKTLDGWKIDAESVELIRGSFIADTLSWAVKVERIIDEPDANLSYGNAVEFFANGVRRFVGWIREVSPEGSKEGHLIKYTCKNAWHELEVLTYQQDRNTKSSADSFTNFFLVRTPVVVLGARVGLATLTKVDTKNQMEDLLDYAIAGGVALQRNVNFSGLVPPYEERNNVTVATAIRAMASLTPDCVSWFDYTTTPPTIFIRRRPTETAVSIDLLGGAPLIGFKPFKALEDMKPTGVDLTVVSNDVNPVDGRRYALLTKMAGGSSLFQPRQLTGIVTPRGFFSTAPETTPEDLADAYYEALQETFYEGALTFSHSPTIYRPGNLVNLLNGWAAWATAKAIVQSVREIPVKRLMIVECGRPPMLNAGTWADLNRRINSTVDPGRITNVIDGTGSSEMDTVRGSTSGTLECHGGTPEAMATLSWTISGTRVEWSYTRTAVATSGGGVMDGTQFIFFGNAGNATYPSGVLSFPPNPYPDTQNGSPLNGSGAFTAPAGTWVVFVCRVMNGTVIVAGPNYAYAQIGA